VFGSNTFLNGQIPSTDPSTFALEYARQFINVNGQIFVEDDAVSDPTLLDVSTILLDQSDNTYLSASNHKTDYILNQTPRYNNDTISQHSNITEL
jgi:hypothetical protein